MALPGSGKTFDQFREDDIYCKQYANEQVKGQTPNRASILSGLGTAALATALGAAAGAAFGGGTGAAIGAGSGLLVGGLAGTSSASTSGNIGQQRYDIGYTQCMYGKGNHVPLSGQIEEGSRNQPQGNSSQPLSGPSIPPPPHRALIRSSSNESLSAPTKPLSIDTDLILDRRSIAASTNLVSDIKSLAIPGCRLPGDSKTSML